MWWYNFLKGVDNIDNLERVLKKRHFLKLHKIKERKREDILSYISSYLFNVPVKIVMDRDFLKLKPQDTISILINSFDQEETAAIIVDERDKLLGVITMKDLLRFFSPPKRYSIVGLNLLKCPTLSKGCTVENLMVKNPITIGIDDNLGQAIRVILETGKHHLPVIDKERRVHGLLEVKDIIRFIRLTW
ncbi:MAG: CBS domain-containing protein [Synergistetes bacterium]|nr:CBS domain-containing protein [Synergistota bacterium]MDW8191716.1 CBS domain-containing protein [Synergistota bacterium]